MTYHFCINELSIVQSSSVLTFFSQSQKIYLFNMQPKIYIKKVYENKFIDYKKSKFPD